MANIGHPTATRLKKLTDSMRKIALGYLCASSSSDEQPAEAQIAGITSTCLRDVHYMSDMTKAFGGGLDKSARQERVKAQVQQALEDLISQSHLYRRGEGSYRVTFEGRQHYHSLSGARR